MIIDNIKTNKIKELNKKDVSKYILNITIIIYNKKYIKQKNKI